MKKLAAILLASLMAFSLFACNKTADTSQASSSLPPETASTSPETIVSSPSAPAETAEAGTPSASTGTTGYITDEFDHFSREPFKIAYVCATLEQPFTKAISDDLEKLGKVLNYDYIVYNGAGENFINQLETLAGQGYEGFIISSSNDIINRAYEVCRELGVAFIAESTGFRDEAGKCIWPSVEQDQFQNGAMCVQWLADNYKNYWTDDFDTSKLGLIPITFSVVSSIHDRVPGMEETFKKLFPEAAGNIYIADLISVAQGVPTQQNAIDIVTPIIVAHPEIEKWL